MPRRGKLPRRHRRLAWRVRRVASMPRAWERKALVAAAVRQPVERRLRWPHRWPRQQVAAGRTACAGLPEHRAPAASSRRRRTCLEACVCVCVCVCVVTVVVWQIGGRRRLESGSSRPAPGGTALVRPRARRQFDLLRPARAPSTARRSRRRRRSSPPLPPTPTRAARPGEPRAHAPCGAAAAPPPRARLCAFRTRLCAHRTRQPKPFE